MVPRNWRGERKVFLLILIVFVCDHPTYTMCNYFTGPLVLKIACWISVRKSTCLSSLYQDMIYEWASFNQELCSGKPEVIVPEKNVLDYQQTVRELGVYVFPLLLNQLETVGDH